jgi:uncharacterized membrane protein (UPF0127 family)
MKSPTSLTIALILSGALSHPCAQASGPRVQELILGKSRVQAELAMNFQQREIGLMNRHNLAENSGMLFVFDVESSHCMWMKDTPLSLSVAFVSEEGFILNIEEMTAETEDSHCAATPARYALEMNKGWFSRHHIVAGQHIAGLPPLAHH